MFVGRAAIGTHTGLGKLRELFGQRPGFGQRLSLGYQTVGQPPVVGLAGADLAASQDHVEGAAVTDQPRQPHRAAVDQRHAPAPAKHAEPGALRGHAQVAPQRELEAARHGVPLDGGDHRLGQKMACRPHRARPLRILQRDAVSTGRDLEIVAGAKRAAATRQDRHRLTIVGIEGEEGVAQQARGLGIDGVARLGEAVDRDDRDRSFFLDRDLSHSSVLASCATACRPAPCRPSGS